ncbi:MAG: SDR family NAD(P)-dependent oxidoreductase [Alphaproteobacteria bacterium]|nr:SDR family NAD(P)-dependent oxidoreductase [Alphaproteobacteria bacterium]
MLKGKCAVVTGSSMRLGIGYAIADALAAEGCAVVLSGRRPEEQAKDVVEALARARGVAVHYQQADLARPHDVEALIAAAVARFGRVDILVNNAGTNHPHPIEDLPPAEWDEIVAVNLSAAYHAIRLTLPQMRARNWGRIINIASTLGLVGHPNVSAYTATKHGIVGLTKSVALETAATGITCNAICPGYTRTDLLIRVIGELADIQGLSHDEAEGKMLDADQPSRAMVASESFGALAAFLCSEAAAQIRGVAYAVDGGWTAR